MNAKLAKVKEFVQDHQVEIAAMSTVVVGTIAMYYIGKSRGKILIDTTFRLKEEEAPFSLPRIQVR